MKAGVVLAVSMALLVVAEAGAAAEDSRDGSWSEVRPCLKAVGREVGHTTRDLSTRAAQGLVQATREVGHATRDASRQVAKDHRGLLSRARAGLSDALDELAAALRSLTSDSG